MSTGGEPPPALGVLALRAQSGRFLERIRRAFDVLRLRADAVDALADDDGAFLSAAAVAALAGVAMAAGDEAGLAGHALAAVAWLALSMAFTAAVRVVAGSAFGARGGFVRLYRAFGHTYLALWVAGVPPVHAALVWALWLWQLVAGAFVVERVCGLTRRQAAATVGGLAAAGLFLVLLVNGLLAVLAMAVAWLF